MEPPSFGERIGVGSGSTLYTIVTDGKTSRSSIVVVSAVLDFVVEMVAVANDDVVDFEIVANDGVDFEIVDVNSVDVDAMAFETVDVMVVFFVTFSM